MVNTMVLYSTSYWNTLDGKLCSIVDIRDVFVASTYKSQTLVASKYFIKQSHKNEFSNNSRVFKVRGGGIPPPPTKGEYTLISACST